jgi:hypothetical protein
MANLKIPNHHQRWGLSENGVNCVVLSFQTSPAN